jgi:hypothetical protein
MQDRPEAENGKLAAKYQYLAMGHFRHCLRRSACHQMMTVRAEHLRR